MKIDESLSLYFHIPFCRHRCTYCDFNTYTTVGELIEPYVAALSREIGQVAGSRRRKAHTIYLGGGTPSLLLPEHLKAILSAAKESFRLSSGAEITLEANPETIDPDYLAEIHFLGINRLSLGVQSAHISDLTLLGRQHDFAAVIQVMEWCRAIGFDDINLDLIYGLPGQSLASWKSTLDAVLALHPEHLSLYCLTIEPGTPLQRLLTAGHIVAPDPDLAADQFILARDRLGNVGYHHYEISNWARPGHECQHNLTYWRNSEYLGLGAGAHGHAAGYRYKVVRQPRVYIRRMSSDAEGHFPWSAAASEVHQLNDEEAKIDTIITQLRLLTEGLDLVAFENSFRQTLYEAYPGIVDQLVKWGLIKEENDRLLLSERGQFLSNQVFYRFF